MVAAAAWILFLAWELLYAVGAAKKRKKKKVEGGLGGKSPNTYKLNSMLLNNLWVNDEVSKKKTF